MDSTVSPSRSRSALHDGGPRHGRYGPASETFGERRPALALAPRRVNQSSPEVITNILGSLSTASDQSEQVFDRLVPVQERSPKPPTRSSKRPQPGSTSREAPPPVPILVTGEVQGPEDKGTRPEPNYDTKPNLERRLDTNFSRLPAVQEVVSPPGPSNMSPRRPSLATSSRPKVGSNPSIVEGPRRSASVNSQHVTTPALNENGSTREAFASISITPGKTTNESVKSGDSGGKRLGGLGRSSSRARSAKDKIRELDAEQKRRNKTKSRKAPGTPKSTTAPDSPGLGKAPASPGLPSPAFLNDGNLPSPLKNGFLASDLEPSNGVGSKNVSELARADTDEAHPHAGPSDLSKLPARSLSRTAFNGAGIQIPARASSRQSVDTPRRGTSRASSPSHSRSGSRSTSRPKKSGEAARGALDRNEEETKRRIRELQKAKQMRKEKEEMMAKLNEPPRAILGNIMPNGGVTRLDSDSIVDGKGRSKAIAEERSTKRTRSALSGADSEVRGSFQQARGLIYTAKPKEQDTFSLTDSIDDEIEEYIGDPRLSQTIYHPVTKRCISYSDVGDPNGAVVIICVGMGTTRFVAALFEEFAASQGLRLITPERPGIGDSEPYGADEMATPLGWPDDIRLICQHLNIKRFMLLAHSAGAVYALATALRMPSEIRGRVHILAPWIPPSQLVAIGQNQEPVPVAELPFLQRVLRSIPEPFLDAMTRIFNLSSLTTSLGKSPYAKRRRRNTTGATERRRGETPAATTPPPQVEDAAGLRSTASSPVPQTEGLGSPVKTKKRSNSNTNSNLATQPNRNSSATDVNAARFEEAMDELTEEERMQELQARMNATIWNLATANANPAIDLTVCLERKQEIGFRYEDITKQVVMHHGTKDTRVSVENVKWIGEKMRRCEVRIMEGYGHGLLADGSVMADVLQEMAQDWENWNTLVNRPR